MEREAAKDTASDVYSLDTGDGGAARLRLLDRVYGPSTHRMLLAAGLAKGTRALDLACGIGAVSCWMADHVGRSGSVVAVDVSPDQLAVSKANCAACAHPAIEFFEASAYDTGLPAESFDLVHMRLLLCHLTDPARALREVYRLLKPGGVFVCQDLKMSSIFCSPPSPAYTQMLALALAVGPIVGVDYDYGVRLPAAVIEAGFLSPQIHLEQPAYLQGPEKRLWEHTFAEGVPAMVRTGVASAAELHHLLEELRQVAADDRVLIGHACLPGVIAFK